MKKTFLLIFIIFSTSICLGNNKSSKILLIGNSYLFYPGNPVRPTLKVELEKISDQHNKTQKFEITAFTKPGFTLKQHYIQPRLMNLLNQDWDYIILQGQSLESLGLPERKGLSHNDFINYGKKLIEKIPTKTRILLFAHWIRSDRAKFKWNGTKQSYQERINYGYQKLVTQSNTEVLRVGDKWLKLLNSPNSPFSSDDLYNKDGSHPTYLGTYINAAIIFNKISGLSALNSNHQFKELSAIKKNYLKTNL